MRVDGERAFAMGMYMFVDNLERQLLDARELGVLEKRKHWERSEGASNRSYQRDDFELIDELDDIVEFFLEILLPDVHDYCRFHVSQQHFPSRDRWLRYCFPRDGLIQAAGVHTHG